MDSFRDMKFHVGEGAKKFFFESAKPIYVKWHEKLNEKDGSGTYRFELEGIPL